MTTTEALDGYSRIRLVDSIDDRIMAEAKEKFEKYARQGIIEKVALVMTVGCFRMKYGRGL